MPGMSGMSDVSPSSGLPIALAIASFGPSRCTTHTHISDTLVTPMSNGPAASTIPSAWTCSSPLKLPAGILSPPFRAVWLLALPATTGH